MVLRYPLGSGFGVSRRLPRRGLLIGIHGTAAALIAFGVHHVSRGIVAAGALMLALFLAAVTIGCVIATVIEGCEAKWSPAGRRERGATICHSCGQPMQERQSIRACRRCDRIILDR
jgi:hypothetical protein